MISAEQATIIATLTGALLPVLMFFYKIFKTSRVFLSEQEGIKKSIETIKAEVTHNSGKSLKDTVSQLKRMCERIEISQKVLDQRSKAALHYTEQPLFETDKSGKIIWTNDSFRDTTKDYSNVTEGHDWVAIIDENLREGFLTEFKSCLKMSRKIDVETLCVNGAKIHFVGYPYKTSSTSHEGFLIHFYKEN
jgi:transcriptional regulator with PAS, ATPase and Fis domain